MTRILALGDTQLGVQTVTLESQAHVLDRIADVAIERDVDLVLHGGDVFEGRGSHGNVITPEQLDVFRSFVARLREAEIPVLAISGNGVHDSSMRAVNGLRIFEDIPGITISSRPFVYNIAGCNIITLPWVSPARLIAETDGGVDRDGIDWTISRLLPAIAHDLLNLETRAKVNPRYPNVLLLHWSISGASLPTGLSVDQLHEPVLEWAELDALGFDLIIASHIHVPQRLDDPKLGDATMGIYTGSPQPLSHGEGHYQHGVWLAEIAA